MMCLSKRDIEVIGNGVLQDYFTRYARRGGDPIKIDVFAKYHLGLGMEYRKLSDDGRILGITTYKGVLLGLVVGGEKIEVSVPGNTILLDEILLRPENERRRRFTVAHECSHQILSRMEEIQTGHSFRRKFESGKSYTCNQIKTIEEWSEWQANTLAAVLLMPKFRITPQMMYRGKPYIITSYGGRFSTMDYNIVKELSDSLLVSKSAMTKRLYDLGFVVKKPESYYLDPLDVIAG